MASFLGLDIGTSSVKAILVDPNQSILAESAAALALSRPHPLWSKQSAEDWWHACTRVKSHSRPMRHAGSIRLPASARLDRGTRERGGISAGPLRFALNP